MTWATIKKADDELQIVYAEVYSPMRPDSDGDYMTATDVRIMAHEFIQKNKTHQVDTQHDNEPNGSYVVESWVQQEDSETYLKGAWCVGIHVPDNVLWKSIKAGDITGFSMEATVFMEETEIEVIVPEILSGETIDDGKIDHVHKWTVRFSPEGKFLGGSTDVVDGHSHTITQMTKTSKEQEHSHGVFVMEGIHIAED